MPIIFKNLRFPEMLRLLKNICSADAVQNERSKFVGQLGKKVASSVLTVIDDPHMDNGYGTASFDGEGYPTAYKEVIKDGILETYLHNLKTANKDKVRPTGNSSGNRGITVFNFYVKPGETSFEYLLKEAGDGVFIDDLMGISTGFNQISGDFSFGASGFVIENGKLGEHLKLVTISGNFYQMLKDIRMIGNDLEFHLNNIGSPSVLVDGLMVASK